jgi:hypothetical protein
MVQGFGEDTEKLAISGGPLQSTVVVQEAGRQVENAKSTI